MKLLSLWEPWATLMSIEAKRIETRGWSTLYRGPVAIHATKGGLSRQALLDTCLEDEFYEALQAYHPFADLAKPQPISLSWISHVFPHGHVIAVGNLVDCLPTETVRCLPGVFDDHPTLKTARELAFGDYAPGRYGLVFDNVMPLKRAIPFKSRQGKLLDLTPEEIRAIETEYSV